MFCFVVFVCFELSWAFVGWLIGDFWGVIGEGLFCFGFFSEEDKYMFFYLKKQALKLKNFSSDEFIPLFLIVLSL